MITHILVFCVFACSFGSIIYSGWFAYKASHLGMMRQLPVIVEKGHSKRLDK
jgi:hypothetical protein